MRPRPDILKQATFFVYGEILDWLQAQANGGGNGNEKAARRLNHSYLCWRALYTIKTTKQQKKYFNDLPHLSL